MKIDDFFLYVENHLGCLASLEPLHDLFRTSPRLAFPNFMTLHNHEYCRFIKSGDKNYSCAINKHRTMRLARHGRPFHGCCPYGVWEFVQPILFQGELAAVLYLGTFSLPDHPVWREKSRQYTGIPLMPYSADKLPELKEAARFFSEFLQYELQMAQDEAVADATRHVKEKYCDIVRNLIALRYTDDLHLKDAAEACQVTPNYLCNLLKATTGRNFKELLTEQRLVEAEACLKYRSFSMAEIARKCGFRDGNYFSVVFRKYRGMSPSEYRIHWERVKTGLHNGKRKPGQGASE